jgi:predicted RNA-binding Zn-ribbon protein involved in translation (DUF1610 family)
MARERKVSTVQVKGHPLECTICKHQLFWTRETLLNTPGMTFFGLEWANKSATNYVCDNCGFVMWFINS